MLLCRSLRIITIFCADSRRKASTWISFRGNGGGNHGYQRELANDSRKPRRPSPGRYFIVVRVWIGDNQCRWNSGICAVLLPVAWLIGGYTFVPCLERVESNLFGKVPWLACDVALQPRWEFLLAEMLDLPFNAATWTSASFSILRQTRLHSWMIVSSPMEYRMKLPSRVRARSWVA
jgi:hypothetical protein